MQTNQLKKLPPLFLAACLVFGGVFIFGSCAIPISQNSEIPGVTPSPITSSSSFDLSLFPVPFAMQPVIANEITMCLIDHHIEGVNYRVEICYEMPNNRDWLTTDLSSPYTTFLQFEETQIYPVEEGTIGWVHSADGIAIGRCQYLIFARPHPVFTEMTLTVQSLFSYYKVGQDECNMIQNTLLDLNNFSPFECMNVRGVDGLAIVRAPHQSFRDRVLQQSWSRLPLDKKRYEGSWDFKFVMAHP